MYAINFFCTVCYVPQNIDHAIFFKIAHFNKETSKWISPVTFQFHVTSWGPFLETPDNFLGLKTILGAQYFPIAIQFLLILKSKF